MKSVIMYEPHIIAPVCGEIVDANFEALDDRVTKLEEAGKAKDNDFASNDGRVSMLFCDTLVSQARLEERQRAAGIARDTRCWRGEPIPPGSYIIQDRIAEAILDGPDEQPKEADVYAATNPNRVNKPRFTRADLDAAVDANNERCGRIVNHSLRDLMLAEPLGISISSYTAMWDRIMKHILNGDEVPE